MAKRNKNKNRGGPKNNNNNNNKNETEEKTAIPNINTDPSTLKLGSYKKKLWNKRTNIQTITVKNLLKTNDKGKAIKRKPKRNVGGWTGIKGRFNEEEEKKKKEKKLAPEDSLFGNIEEKIEKYKRVDTIDFNEEEMHKNLVKKLKKQNQFAQESAIQAAKVEVFNQVERGELVPENPMEKTWTVTQSDLVGQVDLATTRKIFDLSLEFGPYKGSYSLNGTHLLLMGSKGHISLLDWKKADLKTEFQLKETARSATFLQDDTMFAVAQYQYGYVYDNQGIEIHRMRDHHGDLYALDYLPYHWLLCSIGARGQLTYQDHSTGDIVARYNTLKGACHVMKHNPQNGVILLGHHQGSVTMWTPNINSAAVTMLAHQGPVTSLAVDKTGKYLVTTGNDTSLKVFDLRTYRELDTYYTPDSKYMSGFSSVTISQTGMVAASCANVAYVWKDIFNQRANELYMTFKAPSDIRSVQFCPYEDILGVGHRKGFSSVLIPGSGEPNFDSLEHNPFQTKAQRREAEVHNLLEKIPADMISLDPHDFGTVKYEEEFIDMKVKDHYILTDLDKRELARQQNFEEKMRIMREKEEERERIKSDTPRSVMERFKKRGEGDPKKHFTKPSYK